MKKVKAFRGARMKAARKDAGFQSAREFARKHRLNEITYSQHEQGRRNASTDDLEHYAKLLKVEPAWLSHEHVTTRDRVAAPKRTRALMWRIELPVRQVVRRGERMSAAKAFSTRTVGKARLPCSDPRVAHDQQFVYSLSNMNTITPIGGTVHVICSPFSRADARKGMHVIAAVRRDDKFEITVAEIVAIRPEYFTLNVHDQQVTATPERRERYLATILARVLGLHRSL